MEISMAGVDYNQAKIEDRECFSFTKSALQQALKQIREWYPEQGCVILSTCNRTEIWMSGQHGSLVELLCKLKGVSPEKYHNDFYTHQGREAAAYLMELSCGFHSQIFGEDQILTQLKQALALSREMGTTDAVLEALFRSAVTASKRVKSQMKLVCCNRSMTENVIKLLFRHFSSLDQLSCLVIGNGEMGRLMAERLLLAGCKVTMTLRQYKTKDAVIPAGCDVIHYDERIAYLNRVSVVISATLSPHYTLRAEEAYKTFPQNSLVLVDLAVPRDIDPKIAAFEKVTLYNVDQLGEKFRIEDNGEIAKAKEILNQFLLEFENWYHLRQWIPTIQQVSEIVAEDVGGRMKKKILHAVSDEQDRKMLTESMLLASERAFSHLLFGFRDYLDRQSWEDCMRAFLQFLKEERR